MLNLEKDKKQKEIVAKLPTNPHGILLLAPRFGKSKVAIDILNRDKPNTVLWVTPSTKLRDEDIPQEILQWSNQELLNKTTIICWASLSQITGFYDTIILDEHQYITEDNSYPLLSKDLQYKNIICLSGTHPKDRDKNNILKQLGLRIFEHISIEEAVDLGMIADYDIHIIQTSLNNIDKNVKAGNKANPFYITEQAQYKYFTDKIDKLKDMGTTNPILNRLRMNFIYKSLSKENTAISLLNILKGERNFIFCSTIDQAEKLGNGNTYHSKLNTKIKNQKLEAFINGNIDELYCVKSGGVGFTYRDVDNFIIIQSDSDNNGLTSQKLCRALVEQENYKAKIFFIVLKNTVDEIWLDKTLERFNPEKVIRWNSVEEYSKILKEKDYA